ncbi:MAG: MFS transporter [Tissierellia bacterium]|nr:MFS transporter [Tissierellia bacterium]
MKKKYTLLFSLYQAIYALILLPFFAYGTYYLIHLGLNNVTIGIILASANGIAVLAQSPMASLADKNILRLEDLLGISLSIFILAGVGLVLGYFPLFFYPLALISLYLLNPLLNSLNVEWNHSGHNVDFGVAKGVSSLSYAFFSLLIGKLLISTSPKILPYTATLGGMVLLFFIWKNRTPKAIKKEVEIKKERISLLKKMPSLIGLLLGISMVYANYSMYNSYLIHTIRSLGGKESSLGIAVAIAALSEVPIMVFFTPIMKKFQLKNLLVASAFFFTLKTLIAYLAQGMFMLYLAQFLQMLSFGLYIPTSVYYMASISTKDNRAEAQASITGAAILGSLFASILGGTLIQYRGISTMLLVATLLSACGAVLIYIFSERISHEEK